MKIQIYADEAYPVYGYQVTAKEQGIEVPEDKLSEWDNIQEQYDRMQGEMVEMKKQVKR